MQEKRSISDELRRLAVNAVGFESGTALYAFIDYVNQLLENRAGPFTERYAPIVRAEAEDPAPRPFLSVITRTQGRRPDRLREMLLSLAAQTDEDFELLLVGFLKWRAARARFP